MIKIFFKKNRFGAKCLELLDTLCVCAVSKVRFDAARVFRLKYDEKAAVSRSFPPNCIDRKYHRRNRHCLALNVKAENILVVVEYMSYSFLKFGGATNSKVVVRLTR